MAINLGHAALRLATGAFILNSGLEKLKIDKDTASALQNMATKAFPQLEGLDPEMFGRTLSYSEIGLGSALLTPFIPSRLVGLGVIALSSGLVLSYLRNPQFTQSDGIRPSQQGTPIAKDFWLLAIGIALLIDPKRKKRKAK